MELFLRKSFRKKKNILNGKSNSAQSEKVSAIKKERDEIDLTDEKSLQRINTPNGNSITSLREKMEKQALDKLNKQNGTNFTSLHEAMGSQ